MIMHEIIDRFHSLDGLLHIAPEPDSPYPELLWGDHFFYFAPDGEVPANTQPFATITTKDYPDDTASRLSAPDRWRLNLHIGRARFSELVDEPGPDTEADTLDRQSVADTIHPHPLYSRQGWIAVVNPAGNTEHQLSELLIAAHTDARRRWERAHRARAGPPRRGSSVLNPGLRPGTGAVHHQTDIGADEDERGPRLEVLPSLVGVEGVDADRFARRTHGLERPSHRVRDLGMRLLAEQAHRRGQVGRADEDLVDAVDRGDRCGVVDRGRRFDLHGQGQELLGPGQIAVHGVPA